MKSEYLLIATLCIGLVLLISFLAGTALAHHYRYFALDPRLNEDSEFGMPKNYVSAHWALTPAASSIRYYVDESTLSKSPPRGATATPNASLVMTAVAGWESAEESAPDEHSVKT